MQYVVCRGRGGAVGAFDDHFGSDSGGVGLGDLLFQRSRDQDVALNLPKRLVGNHLGLAEACHAAKLCNVGKQGRNVQPRGFENRAAVVLYCNYGRTRFGKQPARHAAYIAKALNGNARSPDLHADVFGCFYTHGEYAAPRGITPSE